MPGAMQSVRTRLWKPAGILALVVCVAFYLLHGQRVRAESAKPSAASLVAVVVARVERRDLPVELKGIGTVQAYNTVTVKPQVGGQIIEIAFTEGQPVRRGAMLARIDPRFLLAQLHQAQANRAKDEAQLENTRRDLARLSEVGAKGYVARQVVDAQQSQVATQQATVEGDQAAIENAKVQLDYATVTAPIDGVTGIRIVDVGNIIAPADPGIVVITQVQPIAVIFTLSADLVATLGAGQEHSPLPVEVFDRDDKTKLADGTLALIDNQIDRSTNTVRLKAIFSNVDGALRPGAFVNAHLQKTVLQSVSVVPSAAVQYDDQGAFTWVVDSNNTVAQRRVVLGPTRSGLVAVEEGLSPDERVVVDGQYGLRADASVSVKASATSSSGADNNTLSIP